MIFSYMDDLSLIQLIKECAYNVRLDFAPGYLESIYKNALLIQLREAGIFAEKEKELTVLYHGEIIGQFRVDILVENRIILELKAVSDLKEIHEVQLVNYLNITKHDIGILINYGSEKYRFMTKFRTIELLNEYKSSLK